MTKYLLFFIGLLLHLNSIVYGGEAIFTPISSQAPISNERQTQIEDRLVSVFENATLEIQYDYIQNLNDGRGYTAGRSGFTSATDDLLQVVTLYNKLQPNNPLSQFLPALHAVNGTDSTAGLSGFAPLWRASIRDSYFIEAQNTINEQLYRQPARDLTNQLGLKLPLSKAAIYEAGIQHGYGDDFDSLNQIAHRASQKVGGTPSSGIDEKIWLFTFLNERKKDLLQPANKNTATEWRASADRANAMLSIYQIGNFGLEGVISIRVFNQNFDI